MRRTLASSALALLLVAIGVPAVASGTSEATGRIGDLTTDQGSVSFLYSSAGLPDGVGLDPDSVTVQFQASDQEPVDLTSTVQTVDEDIDLPRLTAVLTVDTSGSLGDDGMAAVRDAATAFLQSVSEPVEVGLVTFGEPAVIVQEPTTDRAVIQAAIDGLEAGGGTALYDATILATTVLPGEGIERILVLTDGEDENALGNDAGSEATLEDAVAAVDASGAGLNAVAFGDGASQEALQALAAAGQGQLVDATESEALADAFEAVAESIATSLVVNAEVPPELAGQRGNIVVTAEAGSQSLTTAAFTTLASVTTPQPSQEASEAPAVALPIVDIPRVELPFGSTLLYVGLGAFFVALLTVTFIVVGVIRGRDPMEVKRQRSLAVYSMGGRGRPSLLQRETAQATKLGDSAVARSAVEFAGRAVERRNATERLARTLDAAAVPLRPGEWVVIHVAIAFGAAILFLLLSAGNVLVMLVGLALGAIGPRVYLNIKTGRRKSAFVRVMPETLGLMASGLRAGYSLPQAMDSVAREGQEPLKSEFNRALVEARLGVPPDEALEGIADRMDSKDFRWVVMAIRIQREVGGNLAELLDTVSSTLRERARLRRQVEVLSAEGKLSAYVVGALPLLFAIYVLLTQPDYLRPLYTDPLGIILLGFGVVIFGVGVLGLRWAVKVDV